MRENRLSLKQLESHLQRLDDFTSPRSTLEQYVTPPHIAALVLNTIDTTYGDLDGKFVADLGCGTGRLTIGSLLCGAAQVIGFDIDCLALRSALGNVFDVFNPDDDDDDEEDRESSGLETSRPTFSPYVARKDINFIQADVCNPIYDPLWDSFTSKFDTVIMNPPFGTKNNQGIDIKFLERAINLSRDVVYSLHKTSTRGYILNKCQQWGLKGQAIAQIKYNIENTYRFHRKRSVDIDVDLWRIEIANSIRRMIA